MDVVPVGDDKKVDIERDAVLNTNTWTYIYIYLYPTIYVVPVRDDERVGVERDIG